MYKWLSTPVAASRPNIYNETLSVRIPTSKKYLCEIGGGGFRKASEVDPNRETAGAVR